MNDLTQLLGIAPSQENNFWLIAKIFVLIGLFIYNIFAIVIVKQTFHMTDTLEVGFELPIRAIAFLHLVFALFVFIVAIMIL